MAPPPCDVVQRLINISWSTYQHCVVGLADLVEENRGNERGRTGAKVAIVRNESWKLAKKKKKERAIVIWLFKE